MFELDDYNIFSVKQVPIFCEYIIWSSSQMMYSTHLHISGVKRLLFTYSTIPVWANKKGNEQQVITENGVEMHWFYQFNYNIDNCVAVTIT